MERSSHSRRLLLGCLVVLSVPVLLGIVFVWLRSPTPELTEAALVAAQQRWGTNGPTSYELNLKLKGTRPGTVFVRVYDGQVTAMQRDGVTPRQRRTWDVWTIEGQFDMLRRELELAADPRGQMQAKKGSQLVLRARFDRRLGYPLRYHRAVLGGGPEVYWEVARFEALP